MIAALRAQINVPSVVGLGRIVKRRAFNAQAKSARRVEQKKLSESRQTGPGSPIVSYHSAQRTAHTRTGLQQCSENYVQNNLYSFLTRTDGRRPSAVIKGLA